MLDLAYSKLGTSGVVVLAEGLHLTPRLRALSLHGASFGDAGMVALAPVLPTLPELCFLDVSSCMNHTGEAALATHLGRLQQLRHLDVSAIGGHSTVVFAAINDLLRAIACLQRLQYLNIRENELRNEGVIVLANVIRWLPRLCYLDLRMNSIGDVGNHAIAASLSYTPQLEGLFVKRNWFGEGSYRVLQVAAARHGAMIDRFRMAFSSSRDYLYRPVMSIKKADQAL